jgi:L-asparaginase / beta-aspartyl-peptidase
MTGTFAIAIHGGAGTILRSTMTAELQELYEAGLKTALERGYAILEQGGSSLDAVEAAVTELENFPLFNAGKGSVFNNEGNHEMDAAIMEGKSLKAGAVTGVGSVKNPVKLARLVMEQSEHVMLAGKGAEIFAEKVGVERTDKDYFYNEMRYQQWLQALKEDKVKLDHSEKKFGTVGAVALDKQGNLAAATSTGGMTNKKFGRVGDSPVIGAGTYANNNTCAVSCTGHGEPFLRAVVAHDISCLMEYKGLPLEEATHILVHDKLMQIEGEGGLIAIDNKGNIAMPFNSEGMYRGSMHSNDAISRVNIYKD